MRTVVLLATLARYLTRSIFTASYLPQDEKGFPYILIDMAAKDPMKEQFCRGLMLSATHDETPQLLAKKVSKIVEDTVKLVEGLIGSSRAAAFKKEVTRVAESAADIWRKVETGTSHFEADLGNSHVWEWKTLRLDNTGMHVAEQTVKAEDLLTDTAISVVFPRVYTVDGDDDVPVFPA